MNGTYQNNRPKKRCKELRAQALESLRGKWLIAILAMLLASFLGAQLATTGSGSNASFNLNTSDLTGEDGIFAELNGTTEVPNVSVGGLDKEDIEDFVASVESLITSISQEEDLLLVIMAWGIAVAMGTAVVLAFSLAFTLFLGTPMRIGHLRFRLSLIDGERAELGEVFSGFDKSYLPAIGLRILRGIYLFLWGLPSSLMAIIGVGALTVGLFTTVLSPVLEWELVDSTLYLVGALALIFAVAFSFLRVVAVYRYAMSDYILAENPQIPVSEALRESARMMKGNKWRLFCLELSFIGWGFLCLLTCGIGYLWLRPYMYQAEAALYHEISGREAIHEAVADMKELMEQL